VSFVELGVLHTLAYKGWQARFPHLQTAGPGTTAAALWLAAAAALLIVSAAAAATLCVVILRQSKAGRAWRAHVVMLVMLAAAIAGAMYAIGSPADLDAYTSTAAFESTVGSLWGLSKDSTLCSLLIQFHQGASCGIAEFRVLTVGGSAVAVLVAVFAALATAALVQGAAEDTEAGLARRMEKLKYLLYAASVLLVSGVLFVKAWTEFPMGIAGDIPGTTEFVAVFRPVAASFQLFQAVWYVLLIAALFLPVALVLNRRAVAMAARDPKVAAGQTGADAWLAAHRLSLSAFEQIQGAIALLAPLAAGPLADVAKTVAGLAHH
jgi:hypothetical protein